MRHSITCIYVYFKTMHIVQKLCTQYTNIYQLQYLLLNNKLWLQNVKFKRHILKRSLQLNVIYIYDVKIEPDDMISL